MWNMTKGKKVELLPCPICGGKVSSRMRYRGSSVNEIFDLDIYCNNSQCGLMKSVRLEINDTPFEDVLNAINNAINSWNKRFDVCMDDCK